MKYIKALIALARKGKAKLTAEQEQKAKEMSAWLEIWAN